MECEKWMDQSNPHAYPTNSKTPNTYCYQATAATFWFFALFYWQYELSEFAVQLSIKDKTKVKWMVG